MHQMNCRTTIQWMLVPLQSSTYGAASDLEIFAARGLLSHYQHMNKVDLLRLVGNHEDNFVERKPESVSKAELRQTVCAFANSVPQNREAVLFVGIEDRAGAVLGVKNTDA